MNFGHAQCLSIFESASSSDSGVDHYITILKLLYFIFNTQWEPIWLCLMSATFPTKVMTDAQRSFRPKKSSLLRNNCTKLSKKQKSLLITMKNAVSWDVAPCRSCVNRRLGEKCSLHLHGRKIRERGTSVSRWLTDSL
jgi:hypothetical protein